jgi:hypothetical protein
MAEDTVSIDLKRSKGKRDAEAEADAERAEEMRDNAPIFDRTDGNDIAYLLVRRVEPLIEDGTLGRLDASATELDILERWGGRKFIVEGKDAQNRLVKGCRRTITIGADPKFESKANEAKWNRQQGITPAAAPGAPSGPSFIELFTLMGQQQEQARKDAQAAHERQLELSRQDAERREREERQDRERAERERAAREERQDRDRRADEDRTRKAESDRDERLRREQEDSRQRDREHQKAILELLSSKQQADGGAAPMEMFIKGIELAKDLLSGGKDEDDEDGGGGIIATSIRDGIKAIPDAIRAARGNPAEGETEAAPAAASRDVTLSGPIADDVRAFVAAQKAKGKDPEKVLAQALRVLSEAPPKAIAAGPAPSGPPKPRPTPAVAPAPAAAAPAPAPEAPAAPTATEGKASP